MATAKIDALKEALGHMNIRNMPSAKNAERFEQILRKNGYTIHHKSEISKYQRIQRNAFKLADTLIEG